MTFFTGVCWMRSEGFWWHIQGEKKRSFGHSAPFSHGIQIFGTHLNTQLTLSETILGKDISRYQGCNSAAGATTMLQRIYNCYWWLLVSWPVLFWSFRQSSHTNCECLTLGSLRSTSCSPIKELCELCCTRSCGLSSLPDLRPLWCKGGEFGANFQKRYPLGRIFKTRTRFKTNRKSKKNRNTIETHQQNLSPCRHM